MSPVQTSYDDAPGIARPGQLADNGDVDIITCLSASDVVVGRFVADAGLASDGKTQLALLPAAAAATDAILGVVVHTHALESDAAETYPTIPAGKPFGVLRKGRIFVSVEDAFDPGSDTAFVRFTANGATKQPGMLAKGADSGKADELGTDGYGVNHRVLQETAAAGVVAVEINLP